MFNLGYKVIILIIVGLGYKNKRNVMSDSIKDSKITLCKCVRDTVIEI